MSPLFPPDTETLKARNGGMFLRSQSHRAFYVTAPDDGWLCTSWEYFGMDVLELQHRLGEPQQSWPPGDLAWVDAYNDLLDILHREHLNIGTWYGAYASRQLLLLLERLRGSRERVFTYTGSRDSNQVDFSWAPVGAGVLSRQEGLLPRPLLTSAMAGSSVLLPVPRLLAVGVEPAQPGRPEWLWLHEGFEPPRLIVQYVGRQWEVRHGAEVLGRAADSDTASALCKLLEGVGFADRLRKLEDPQQTT